MSNPPIRKQPPITAESTREQVVAYLAEHDQVMEWIRQHPLEGLGCGKADDDPDRWGRTESGDVTNGPAFHAHMARVGEEDQTQPGWDGP